MDDRRPVVERDLFAASGPPVSRDVSGDRAVTLGISMWLVAAVALVAGIIIGFASGFTAGQRATAIVSVAPDTEPDSPGAASDPRPERPESAQPFTEGAVTDPVRVDPPPVVSAPEPPRAVPDRPAAARSPLPRTAPVETAGSGPGSLQILSRPTGAQVSIDGRLVGRTPLVISDVRIGAHDVRIELAGFRRWVTSVQVTPGNRTRVAASLEQ